MRLKSLIWIWVPVLQRTRAILVNLSNGHLGWEMRSVVAQKTGGRLRKVRPGWTFRGGNERIPRFHTLADN
jgi:hypothetical protein